MVDVKANRTRERILAISGELFRRQSYAGTSIADIADRLGTSKAAIYYHFSSKEEILNAMITEPIAIYEDIAVRAAEGASAEELLGRLIDLMAAPGAHWAMLEADPSIRYAIDERATQHRLLDKTSQIIDTLRGTDTSRAAWVRAAAAFAITKEATRVMMWEEGTLSGADRAALLAAALDALAPGPGRPLEAADAAQEGL
ncbi:TetR/AcrR family transcriptional regulator [Actinomadura opuntiae]|uniref:TetR/AcrR family transcriptional regulator n=1 Tax=Actinomadura sp. OS1-43 TaxID=604315 RepID=UPI00255A9189|nr:TetR/AcrR family transcriptional regulator [Actinomadura sp. OS1-43]MDL4815412.1 helix-turn-helix domain-containing protein [Actinomadura sp. OS1-43]